MKLWVDDIRPEPEGYVWCKSVNDAKNVIGALLFDIELGSNDDIEVIDIDHDAGDFSNDGGDYIKLLDWLELMGYKYPIHIHSMNPVGVENMRRIIQKNHWKEI